MSNDTDSVIEALAAFRAYKPKMDRSGLVEPTDLFAMYADGRDKKYSAPVSKFARIVHCPYLAWNIGAGQRPAINRAVRDRMQKGIVEHHNAEAAIRQKAKASIATGGPPDLRSASKNLLEIPAKDLLEAPEVSVQLYIDQLALRGRVDGLLRTNGIVTAIERKPRSGWFKPSSALQAMTYAIGGCLHLKDPKASKGASWIVTDYEGVPGPSGRITETACDLVSRLASAYSQLIQFGANQDNIPGLPGPRPGKCASCEFSSRCTYRIERSGCEGRPEKEPIWMKYAKREGRPRGT